MTERVLIISLQAGLGSRLRAITVRRGDLLQRNPESNPAMGALCDWAAGASRTLSTGAS